MQWIALSLVACDDSGGGGDRSPAGDPTADLPPVPDEAPAATQQEWVPEDSCGGDGYVLYTFTGERTSGVGLLDRTGTPVWAHVVDDPTQRVLRARAARDGHGVLVLIGDRVVHNGDRGALLRLSLEQGEVSRTVVRDPHHDFVELPDGRLAWVSYEFSHPGDGASLQALATDRIRIATEGAQDGEGEVFFSTLGDYTRPTDDVPPEGRDGRSLVGFEEYGHGASLGWRERDATFFLMWRWVDTLLAIDAEGVRWEWGGHWSDLAGADGFDHAHFSDLWDDEVLVFDNREPDRGPSRLVQYSFDETSFRSTWSWDGPTFEPGIGDVRRMPGCDTLLVSWPIAGRIEERHRDGTVVWAVTLPGTDRVEFLRELPL